MSRRLDAGFRFRFRGLTALTGQALEGAGSGADLRGRDASPETGQDRGMLEKYLLALARAKVRLDEEGAGGLRAAWKARVERAGGRWSEPPSFVCDASLGGLARWLRAAGYRARWSEGEGALQLVAGALSQTEVMVTTDSRVLEFGTIRTGRLPTLWIPSNLSLTAQLQLVLADLDLELLAPRCMSCGGSLERVAKEAVRERIPPRTAVWKEAYFVCRDCGRLFWEGTHWERIRSCLDEAGRRTVRAELWRAN